LRDYAGRGGRTILRGREEGPRPRGFKKRVSKAAKGYLEKGQLIGGKNENAKTKVSWSSDCQAGKVISS